MAKKENLITPIIEMFQRINEIPRCSKKEERICQWLTAWAKEHGFPASRDNTGNILIQVPGTKGCEQAAPVIIQGHVDMVCEKDPDSPHNFDSDPIKLVQDGDWLKAEKTSLGADNGIAVAMGLVLALDKGISRPPLELLFTVDEETGLTGAKGLEPGWLKGKKLINLDSEEEGSFTIGCAGGKETRISLPLNYDEVSDGYIPIHLSATDMHGGHSGINIHLGRANALKIIARTLHMIRAKADFHIICVRGGTAHNAIPRAAETRMFVRESEFGTVSEIVRKAQESFRQEFRAIDPDLKLTVSNIDSLPDRRAMTRETTDFVLSLMTAFPHGVAAMSKDVEGLVETSNNFAGVKVEEGELRIVSSQRSSVMSSLHGITASVEAIAHLAGAKWKTNVGYPAWQPDVNSPLLDTCKRTYKKMFQKDAKVELIHAGLECGIIGDKFPGMDMISFGVTIKDPHSPSERMNLPSVEKVWNFLLALLKDLK